MFCLVFSEVRSNAAAANLRRSLEKGPSSDMSDTPETSCALALIPPNFQLGSHDAYTPKLYVFGQTVWLDEFLRRFPKVASVYLFEGRAAWKFSDFVLTGMLPSSSVALVLGRFDPLLCIPYRVRILYWWPPVAESQLESEVHSLKVQPYLPGTCHRFIRIMITTHPDGATHVFALHITCDMYDIPKATLEPMGAWSAQAGWSTLTSAIFPEACVTWRPPPDGQPLTAEMLSLAPEQYNESSAGLFQIGESYQILRDLQDLYGAVFEFKFNYTRDLFGPIRAADTCRLDLTACSVGSSTGFKITVALHSQLSVFAWGLHDLIFVVPAGAGKPYHALHSITAELTPAVWSAVGASTMAVAAFLYLTHGERCYQGALLLTLAPLLTQPLSFQSVRPRAVFGGWMLTCVVVVAAYQGKLLSFLRDPIRNREIDSWQDWLETDLSLMSNGPFGQQDTDYLSLIGATGLSHDRFRFGFSDWEMLSATAYGKNGSFFFDKSQFDGLLSYFPGAFMRQLHTFPFATSFSIYSCFLTSYGSPVEGPLRKLLGRMRAAGLHRKYRRIAFPLGNQERKPITTYNLKPVLWIYLAGNLVALFAFTVEMFIYVRT
ncbi:uncharacterized protein LOC127752159 [Frankliniella occidentalis]|uniref:Uncharacterized protein LOC127752159 n=1 Tax=Frankliniella occidentalis TaxID=133901 RepID=A0A9C6XBP9_FRAOC|nr:uncharacterized protein LOC127752159 [Frankliniella occidentalis]